jgi:hypothetical protein
MEQTKRRGHADDGLERIALQAARGGAIGGLVTGARVKIEDARDGIRGQAASVVLDAQQGPAVGTPAP